MLPPTRPPEAANNESSVAAEADAQVVGGTTAQPTANTAMADAMVAGRKRPATAAAPPAKVARTTDSCNLP
jgi:hypothetical protein